MEVKIGVQHAPREVVLETNETVDDIAQVAGNYPSRGSGERAAWFRDSEGNMLGIGQPTP